MNPTNVGSNWYADMSVGLLQIWIDDWKVPLLSTPINMALAVLPDDHTKIK